MDILKQHEIFEMEAIDVLNSARLLDPLVFDGGTMLRLCHELNRYSVDLDFWLINSISQPDYFNKLQKAFEKQYEITDAQIKQYTILVEIRSPSYPRRLQIEIRKNFKDWDYENSIAFSRFATRQVILKILTLGQMMKNKISAFLDRGEIRDCFDIEFLIRRGLALSFSDENQKKKFEKKMDRLKDKDFKVKLGAILEPEDRAYYIENRFKFLKEKLFATNIIHGSP
jgi:hypothetical protein